MGWFQSAARTLFGDYAVYRVYGADPRRLSMPQRAAWVLGPIADGGEITSSADPALRAVAAYGGEGARLFGAWADGTLAAACAFWFGARYASRNFWPLAADEAKLVQLVTAEAFRGRGIGSQLIAYSGRAMGEHGFSRVYCRVWHSHAASRAAVRKAGWTYVALVVELFPFGARKSWRFVKRVERRSTLGRPC